MIFNTGYYHPLDKDYNGPLGPISPSNIGATTHPGQSQLEGLKSAIFSGASTVELGFTGTGKGNRGQGQPTPESYGKDEREAMKELARINKIKLSTHAAIGMTGFAGFHENTFREDLRQKNIHETEKAIDFAADVAEGGPIVVHVGEVPRNVAEAPDGKFEGYGGEKGKIVYYLVDDKTGNLISAVKKDAEVWVPKIEGYIDPTTGQIMKEKTAKSAYPVYARYSEDDSMHRRGDIIVQKETFNDFLSREKKINPNITEQDVAKTFFKAQQNAKIEHAEGQAKEYENRYQDAWDQVDTCKKELEHYRDLKNRFPDKENIWMLNKIARERGANVPEGKDPVEYYQETLRTAERQLAFSQETAISARKEAEELKDLVDKRIRTAQDYAQEKTSDSFARLAKFAVDTEEKKKRAGNELKSPLFLAPENMFPEYGYGSHPDELKNLVLESRRKFVELYSKEYGEKEAKKLAESHIKATFDIGHAYTWKKFFTGKPEEFHDWVLNKVEDLAKHNVIGHIHVTDSFGWDDEHLSPGQGVLDREKMASFFARMKKGGFTPDRVIVEAGGQPGGQMWKAMLGGWDVFGSPIYGAERGRSWTGLENSYFGTVNPPPYIFGEYAPSQEFRGAPFWSGLGLE
jgi:sugar phosphate isomerase/epimerase